MFSNCKGRKHMNIEKISEIRSEIFEIRMA